LHYCTTERWLDVHLPLVFITCISPLLGRFVVRPRIDLDKSCTGLRDVMTWARAGISQDCGQEWLLAMVERPSSGLPETMTPCSGLADACWHHKYFCFLLELFFPPLLLLGHRKTVANWYRRQLKSQKLKIPILYLQSCGLQICWIKRSAWG
jgi:hypothetical protein